jgi:hypothetical protein
LGQRGGGAPALEADGLLGVFTSGGALLAVMRAVLAGQAPKDADVHHAECVLRLFGLPPDEAADVARRPLPSVPGV